MCRRILEFLIWLIEELLDAEAQKLFGRQTCLGRTQSQLGRAFVGDRDRNRRHVPLAS